MSPSPRSVEHDDINVDIDVDVDVDVVNKAGLLLAVACGRRLLKLKLLCMVSGVWIWTCLCINIGSRVVDRDPGLVQRPETRD